MRSLPPCEALGAGLLLSSLPPMTGGRRCSPPCRSSSNTKQSAIARSNLLAAGLDRQGVATFLDGLADLVQPVEPWFLWRPQPRDPGDELVLEAAVNGGAAAIATFNRRDYLPAADAFAVEILLPAEILRRLS